MTRPDLTGTGGRRLWGQAWRALTLHKLRSLLSTLGIVFAVIAVVTMLAIAEGAKQETLEQNGRLGMNNVIIRQIPLSEAQIRQARQRTTLGLTFTDYNLLHQLPGIANMAAIVEVSANVAELGETEAITLLAVNPGYMRAMGLGMEQGRFIADIDVENAHHIAVIGAELSRRLGPAGGVGAVVHLDRTPFQVVGVLRNRSVTDKEALPVADRDLNNVVLIPLSPGHRGMVAADRYGELSEIIITAKTSDDVGPLALAARRALLWSHKEVEDFGIIVPRELLHQANQTQRIFNIVLGGIAGISLLVGGIGIMNIMLANVSERTLEIGIRRAIGANQRHIIMQFLGESTLLTCIGGIIGVLAGICVAFGIDFFIHWRTSVSLWSVTLAVLMSIIVGIVSGLYPAVKAARMDPVKALRFG